MDNTPKIVYCIQQAIHLFSDSWKVKYGLFFHTEHLYRFVEFSTKGFKNGFPQYLLESSYQTVIPLHSPQVMALKMTYQTLAQNHYQLNHQIKRQVQESIEHLACADILLLMGQRLSLTSLRDEKALPPLENTLISSCFIPFNNQMSIVVRAWEKHAERSEDKFWPERRGNAKEKEEKISLLVQQFFKQWQWWNVYSHQKHDYVFELRVESGHGMRWTKDGKQFIGFLEPFIEVN